MEELPDKEIFAISGATRQGVESLLETLWRALRQDVEAAEDAKAADAADAADAVNRQSPDAG